MIPDVSILQLMFAHLEDGRIDAIEYGDSKHPGGFLSLFRIRYVSTPGGMQYCIKFLHNGMEGSGNYLRGRWDVRDHALVYIDRYHQKPAPKNLGHLLKDYHKRHSDLTLFVYMDPKEETK
ncbi:hypothetical protein E4H12_12880 [Candidatus Thorarchaeota archaeon]|nr:MAG: hypothetical protein E4H12_12880 [Candidatus Thorarchaeota archaeon]